MWWIIICKRLSTQSIGINVFLLCAFNHISVRFFCRLSSGPRTMHSRNLNILSAPKKINGNREGNWIKSREKKKAMRLMSFLCRLWTECSTMSGPAWPYNNSNLVPAGLIWCLISTMLAISCRLGTCEARKRSRKGLTKSEIYANALGRRRCLGAFFSVLRKLSDAMSGLGSRGSRGRREEKQVDQT